MTDRETLTGLIAAAPPQDILTATEFFKALNWIKANHGKAAEAEQIAAKILEDLDHGTATRRQLIDGTKQISQYIALA